MAPNPIWTAGTRDTVVRFLILGMCLLQLSCDRRVAVADVFHAVAQSPSLANVSIPVTIEELARLRPNAAITAFGLRETVGGAVVEYHGDARWNSDSLPTSAEIRGVEASWTFSTDDSATFVWNREVNRLERLFARSPVCFRTLTSTPHGRYASWENGNGTVVVRQAYLDSIETQKRWFRTPSEVAVVFLLEAKNFDGLLGEPCS